jgi:hypothetical protein
VRGYFFAIVKQENAASQSESQQTIDNRKREKKTFQANDTTFSHATPIHPDQSQQKPFPINEAGSPTLSHKLDHRSRFAQSSECPENHKQPRPAPFNHRPPLNSSKQFSANRRSPRIPGHTGRIARLAGPDWMSDKIHDFSADDSFLSHLLLYSARVILDVELYFLKPSIKCR